MARRARLIIWGPGEVGGAALRAAHASGRFEIVGVKVFSPHKHGKDAGELVGIGPIGVIATRSKAEILAIDADCAIVTPQPRAVLEGLDADVIDLLESGKSVVSTAAYHDVAMPNWYNRARSPSARLREIAATAGAARGWERWALAIVRAVTALRALDPITDFLLRPIADRRIPPRASPERLLAACRKGNSALHGTGVHPSFMVERLLMRMCRSLSQISHIRFAESGDFARAPEGMWGGLSFFGFGQDPQRLGADWVVAKAGDFYYGDVIGNVAHALYGARPDEVRVERSLRGIPAVEDLQIGSTQIRAGTTAALHMIHRGFLGDRLFFTNEECWYLGAANAYHGERVPVGALPPHGGWAFDITGEPSSVRGQIACPQLRADQPHPITIMSVNALLDAVEPVCRAAPGILVDDARVAYRCDEPAPETRPRRPRPYRVVVWGGGGVGTAAMHAARADAGLVITAEESRAELLATPADCVVVTGDPPDIDDAILELLASGRCVVSVVEDHLTAARLREACQRGGSAIHQIGLHATLMISRIAMTLAQGVSAVHHVRVVEARDLSGTPALRRDAVALGLGGEAFDEDESVVDAGQVANAIATVARDLCAPPDLRIVRARRCIRATRAFAIEELAIEAGALVAIAVVHRAYTGGRLLLTSEQWRFVGTAHAEEQPREGHTILIRADPADLESRWELEPSGTEETIVCRMILDAITAVCEAEPGILVEDPRPRYRHDDRVPDQCQARTPEPPTVGSS